MDKMIVEKNVISSELKTALSSADSLSDLKPILQKIIENIR